MIVALANSIALLMLAACVVQMLRELGWRDTAGALAFGIGVCALWFFLSFGGAR